MRGWLVLLFTVAVVFPQPRRERSPEDNNPLAGRPEAVEAGRKLFLGVCSACHGPNGEGGRGTNLTHGRLVRGVSDRELRNSIRAGIPGTDMPPSPLPDEPLWQIVAFVRSLSTPAAESHVRGDPDLGRGLFFGKAGCTSCHMILGRGGFLGPDLSNIGLDRSLRQIEVAVLDPNERLATGHQGATVTLANGTSITGVIRDQTNYAIQMLDAAGRAHRLASQDVRSLEMNARSLMPADYSQRLSKAEIQDLLAFLSRQAVRTRPEVAP